LLERKPAGIEDAKGVVGILTLIVDAIFEHRNLADIVYFVFKNVGECTEKHEQINDHKPKSNLE